MRTRAMVRLLSLLALDQPQAEAASGDAEAAQDKEAPGPPEPYEGEGWCGPSPTLIVTARTTEFCWAWYEPLLRGSL